LIPCGGARVIFGGAGGSRDVRGMKKMNPGTRNNNRIGMVTQMALVMAVLLLPVLTQNPYLLRVATTMFLYAILVTGLNIVAGLGGLLDLGYVAFYALGAYGYGLMASPHLGLSVSFWWAVLIVPLAAAGLAALIGMPILKLRGDYLAIVTLSLGQIAYIALRNLDKPVNITNGPNGIMGIAPPMLGGLSLQGPTASYYLVLALGAIGLLLAYGLFQSRFGWNLRALRSDELAASACGVNPVTHRALAYAVGAWFAAYGGVILAAWQGSVFPDNFTMAELIALYCMLVLGGAGNLWGPLAGSAALVAMPELLRGYDLYRMLVYGLALVIMIRVRPAGIMGSVGLALDWPKYRWAQGGEETRARREGSLQGPSTASTPEGRHGEPVLQLQGIRKTFDGLVAVDGVNLEVNSGEILGVIGPNGAGKSSLLNVISGIYQPDAGHVVYSGEAVTGLPAYRRAQRGIMRTFQNLRLFAGLSVAGNLRSGVTDPEKARTALETMSEGLGTYGAALVSSLTYSDQRRVELARALGGSPSLLLLDEPAAGMTASEVAELQAHITGWAQRGLAVVLVEHRMELVMEVCHRLTVLAEGRIIAEGTPAEIQESEVVQGAYLGTSQRRKPAGAAAAATATTPSTTAASTAAGSTVARAASTPLLSLDGATFGYGSYDVIRSVDLAVGDGDVVALLGPNGAGKTTLIKGVAGTLNCSQGRITFDGQSIEGLKAETRAELGISVVPEGRRLFGRLTVEENLLLGCYRAWRDIILPTGGTHSRKMEMRLEEIYTLFPQLADRRRQKAGTLSGGEQQMVALGRALMSSPRLICLDEPSMGLAPQLIDGLLEEITRIKARGITVLLAEQGAPRALEVADHAYILVNGQVRAEGPPADLLGSGEVERLYLGQA